MIICVMASSEVQTVLFACIANAGALSHITTTEAAQQSANAWQLTTV